MAYRKARRTYKRSNYRSTGRRSYTRRPTRKRGRVSRRTPRQQTIRIVVQQEQPNTIASLAKTVGPKRARF